MMRRGWIKIVGAFLVGALLAGAGTATAAKLITSRDIKDGTIAPRDLSTSVRNQLRAAGTEGPRGPAGGKGEPGAPGTAGTPGATGATGSTGPEGDRTHVVTRGSKAFTNGLPGPYTSVITLPGFGNIEASCPTYPDPPETMYQGSVRFRNTTTDVLFADGTQIDAGAVLDSPGGIITDSSTSPPDTAGVASHEFTLLNPQTDRVASVIIHLRLRPSPTECQVTTYHRVRMPAG